MIYLASPYTHHSADVRQERFRAACEAAAMLTGAGVRVWSPIVYTHVIGGALPMEWEFWKDFDLWFLSRCRGLLVLEISGWISSRGMIEEEAWAASHGLPTMSCRPEELAERLDEIKGLAEWAPDPRERTKDEG